jgi:hypothetical protein
MLDKRETLKIEMETLEHEKELAMVQAREQYCKQNVLNL